jgi:hypothetical protein
VADEARSVESLVPGAAILSANPDAKLAANSANPPAAIRVASPDDTKCAAAPRPGAAMVRLNASCTIQLVAALLVSAMPGAATVAVESVISEVDLLATAEGQFSGHHGLHDYQRILKSTVQAGLFH